jgi:ketosteroid isomerase-like protein
LCVFSLVLKIKINSPCRFQTKISVTRTFHHSRNLGRTRTLVARDLLCSLVISFLVVNLYFIFSTFFRNHSVEHIITFAYFHIFTFAFRIFARNQQTMKSKLFLLIFIAASSVTIAQNKDEQAIRAVLQKQTEAWNHGNIKNFMDGYWENDSLLFIGKSGPKYGWVTTLKNYQKGYPDTASMGKLAFTILQIRKLSVEYYFVVGKWQLQRSIGDIGGHYTLLFRKIKNKWVIVADHSS